MRVLASTEVDNASPKKTAAQTTLDNLARMFPDEVPTPKVEASQVGRRWSAKAQRAGLTHCFRPPVLVPNCHRSLPR